MEIEVARHNGGRAGAGQVRVYASSGGDRSGCSGSGAGNAWLSFLICAADFHVCYIKLKKEKETFNNVFFAMLRGADWRCRGGGNDTLCSHNM